MELTPSPIKLVMKYFAPVGMTPPDMSTNGESAKMIMKSKYIIT